MLVRAVCHSQLLLLSGSHWCPIVTEENQSFMFSPSKSIWSKRQIMWLQQRLKGLPGLLSSSWARRVLVGLLLFLIFYWYLSSDGLLKALSMSRESGGAAGFVCRLTLTGGCRWWTEGREWFSPPRPKKQYHLWSVMDIFWWMWTLTNSG